jgi:hypothetical protein
MPKVLSGTRLFPAAPDMVRKNTGSTHVDLLDEIHKPHQEKKSHVNLAHNATIILGCELREELALVCLVVLIAARRDVGEGRILSVSEGLRGRWRVMSGRGGHGEGLARMCVGRRKLEQRVA